MERRPFFLVVIVTLFVALPVGPVSAQRIGDTPVQPAPADKRTHVGEGTVNRVDVRAGQVTLTHAPIASLGWPGMTMDFVVSDREQLAALEPGQRVRFELHPIGNKYVISSIRPASSSP